MGNSAKPRGLGMSELWIANRVPCANLKPRNEYKWPKKHVYAMNPSTSSNISLASTEKRHCIGSRRGCWTQCKPPLKNAGWFAISTPWHTRNDWNILTSWKSPLPSFETTFIARFKKVTQHIWTFCVYLSQLPSYINFLHCFLPRMMAFFDF